MKLLRDLIKKRDVGEIKALMQDHGLIIKGNRIVPKDRETKDALEKKASFWNQRQQAR